MLAESTAQSTLRRRWRPDATPPALESIDVAAWFGEHQALPAAELAAAWAEVTRLLRANFPGAEIATRPSLTGCLCVESTLPRGYEYPAAPAEIQVLIHQNTPNQRQEAFSSDAPARRVVLYDRRLAWAAQLHGVPTLVGGPVQRDDGAEFVLGRPGWYRAEITVPTGWAHIGLAPRKHPDGRGWLYPSQPGTSWDGWFCWRELALLREYGWPHAIRERVLFSPEDAPGGRPLREFHQRITKLLGLVDARPPTPRNRAIRAALRAVAVRPVGYFARRPTHRLQIYADWAELPAERDRADIQVLPDGRIAFARWAPWDSFVARFHRPEWFASVVSAARVHVARAALSLPREQIGAIDGDALYLLADPEWPDTGKVGGWRRDGAWEFPRGRKFRELDDFRALKRGE